MYHFLLFLATFLFIFYGYECQRRILEGEEVTEDRKYVVYFLEAQVAQKFYDGWLCGGALVTKEFIVTSAACVRDVTYVYAIAGYKKYVRSSELYQDQCTGATKKKIIFICTPKNYQFSYAKLEKWSNIDIAVVKVESPYDFEDRTFLNLCSYIPTTITINYEMKYQEPGVDALVFGWGHQSKWREETDVVDYNQKIMQYGPTLIEPKETCKQEYSIYNGMDAIISKYMICTLYKGNIDEHGIPISTSAPTASGCDMKKKKRRDGSEYFTDPLCEPIEKKENLQDELILIQNSRRSLKSDNETDNSSVKVEIRDNGVRSNIKRNSTLNDKIYRQGTRRSGICQNDHGGPLVTWVGTREVLIGIASVFKVSHDFDCIGPFLFTSTQCNGAFLDCILKSDPTRTDDMRREICESPASVKGFDILEKHISWKDHPDGPADNEKLNTTATPTEDTNTTETVDFNNSEQETLTENTTTSGAVDLNNSELEVLTKLSDGKTTNEELIINNTTQNKKSDFNNTIQNKKSDINNTTQNEKTDINNTTQNKNPDMNNKTENEKLNFNKTTQNKTPNINNTTENEKLNVNNTTQTTKSNINNTTENEKPNVNNTTQNKIPDINNTTENEKLNVNNTTQNTTPNINNTTENEKRNVNNTTQNKIPDINNTTENENLNVNNTTQNATPNINNTIENEKLSVNHTTLNKKPDNNNTTQNKTPNINNITDIEKLNVNNTTQNEKLDVNTTTQNPIENNTTRFTITSNITSTMNAIPFNIVNNITTHSVEITTNVIMTTTTKIPTNNHSYKSNETTLINIVDSILNNELNTTFTNVTDATKSDQDNNLNTILMETATKEEFNATTFQSTITTQN